MPEGSDDEDESEGEADLEESHEDDRATRSQNGRQSKGKKGKTETSPPPSGAEEEDDEEEEGWGKKKSVYYSSNAGQIESDDEEANELEEQEAKRLQAKARDALTDDDFGLGDPVEVPADDDRYVQSVVACEQTRYSNSVLLDAPTLAIRPLSSDKSSLLRHLEKNNPEALALARDWDDTVRKLLETQLKIRVYVLPFRTSYLR